MANILLWRGGGIPFQKHNEKLSSTLKEIILESHDNLLIGINYEYFHTAIHCHESVRKFIHTWVSSHYDSILKYINFDRQYVSAAVFQPYVYYKHYDFETHYKLVTSFFHNKSITLICGDKILKDIQYFIFEQAKEVTYLYGPTKHAYSNFEHLKSLIQKRPKNEILVFALGPAGKALAYEGFKMGYRVLDIGHAIKDYDYYKKQIQLNEQSIRDFSKPDE